MVNCSTLFAYEDHPRTCRKQNGKTERPSDTPVVVKKKLLSYSAC